jgi:hypothetical protein
MFAPVSRTMVASGIQSSQLGYLRLVPFPKIVLLNFNKRLVT